MGSVSGSKSPGVEKGNQLQYCCLKSPMDKGAWQTTVRRVTKSWTGMGIYAHIHSFYKVRGWLKPQKQTNGENRGPSLSYSWINPALFKDQLYIISKV